MQKTSDPDISRTSRKFIHNLQQN